MITIRSGPSPQHVSLAHKMRQVVLAPKTPPQGITLTTHHHTSQTMKTAPVCLPIKVGCAAAVCHAGRMAPHKAFYTSWCATTWCISGIRIPWWPLIRQQVATKPTTVQVPVRTKLLSECGDLGGGVVSSCRVQAPSLAFSMHQLLHAEYNGLPVEEKYA